ncbi:MAG: amidohydrolase family protein [Streptosporangiaceae bacterium]
MRIDVHAHLFPSSYLDLLEQAGVPTAAQHRGLGADDTTAELDARFVLMDTAGVERQVLGIGPAPAYLPGRDRAVALTRGINDLYADMVRRYPARFLAFAALPLPHLDDALSELDRALGDLGMCGVGLSATVNGMALTDPALAPLWAELDRRESVVFVHPAGDCAGSPHIDGAMRWMVGAPVEDTIVAARLITSGHLLRYPRCKIVISHLGGALPLLLERWDNLSRLGGAVPEIEPSEAARLMWYDTVSHGSATALLAAVRAVGADRLLLGSDFPYQTGPMYTHGAVGFMPGSGLEPDQVRRILDGNAASLLGLG